MEEETPKLTPQQEIKEQLRQTRTSFTHAKKLISEIEKGHEKFTKIRDSLYAKENGIEANQTWLSERRGDIANILKDAKTKLDELETTATSVKASVDDIDSKFTKFKPLAEQVFNKQNGLDTVLKATRRLKRATDDLADKIEKDADNASKKLQGITEITAEVDKAYTDFVEKKTRIDDEENGFEAQLRRATVYANSVQDTKTESVSALVSITKFKDQSDELVEQIKDSKTTVDTYKKESETLTEDIRNTLDKVTQITLSKALQDRAKSFNGQMWFWAFLQAVAISALTYAVYLIFEVLFIGTPDHPPISNSTNQSDVLPIISKFLFTTPLIFAVYVTTSNYSHARDLRDKYGWKETVAKNFQGYIKLVREEFKDVQYERERFNFSMDTVRSIYKEPNPLPKKRRFNFSLKAIQVNIEEEDLQELKEALTLNITKEVAKQEETLEQVIEETVTKVAETVAKKDNVKADTPKKKTAQAETISPTA